MRPAVEARLVDDGPKLRDLLLEPLDLIGQGVELALQLVRKLARRLPRTRVPAVGSTRLRRRVDDGERAMALEPIAVAARVTAHFAVILEHERARDDRVEEIAVVADDEQCAVVFDEAFLERFQRLNIEVVGRLVEHEQIRRPREELRKDHAVALAARQRRDRRQRALRRKKKVREIGHDVLLVSMNGHVLAAFADDLGYGLARVELAAKLIEITDLEVRAELYRS